MPRIQEYTASGDFRGSDKGIAAYDTLGRRVAGQYDAAATDMTQAGRVRGQQELMIGRWPFNIIRLQNSAAQQAAARSSGGSPGGVVTRGTSGSITDDQFAPRHMPDLNALNQLSEGMGNLGRVASQSSMRQQANDFVKYGYRPEGSQYGNLTDLRQRREFEDAQINAREEAQRKRERQLDDAASQKRWDNYEKNLGAYNKSLDAWANQPAGSASNTTNDPSSPYYNNYDKMPYNDPNSSLYSPSGTGDYGGTNGVSPPNPNDYGGAGPAWYSGMFDSGNSFSGSDTSGTF